jgi:hypothetical protein
MSNFSNRHRRLVENFCGLPSSDYNCKKLPICHICDAAQTAIQSYISRNERFNLLGGLWEKIVGKKLANSCFPYSFNLQVLDIAVTCDAAIQELRLIEDKIMTAIQSLPDFSATKSLRLRRISNSERT